MLQHMHQPHVCVCYTYVRTIELRKAIAAWLCMCSMMYVLLFSFRREVLRVWKNKLGFKATYQKLLDVFGENRHKACVKALCDILKDKGIIVR